MCARGRRDDHLRRRHTGRYRPGAPPPRTGRGTRLRGPGGATGRRPGALERPRPPLDRAELQADRLAGRRRRRRPRHRGRRLRRRAAVDLVRAGRPARPRPRRPRAHPVDLQLNAFLQSAAGRPAGPDAHGAVAGRAPRHRRDRHGDRAGPPGRGERPRPRPGPGRRTVLPLPAGHTAVTPVDLNDRDQVAGTASARCRTAPPARSPSCGARGPERHGRCGRSLTFVQ